MAKVRVYELARDLGRESKEVLVRAQELGIGVKTASSGLDEDAVELVRMAYEEEAGSAAAALPIEEAAAAPTEPAPAEPVPAAVPEVVAEEAETTEEPAADEAPETAQQDRLVEVPHGVTVSEFADALGRGVGAVVKALMDMGEMVNALAPVPPDALDLLGETFGYDVVVGEPEAAEVEEVATGPVRHVFDDDEADLVLRPAVVTVMGHVDHGKTQLLDTIRQARVVAGEAGGITQHIGAYQVQRGDNQVTFIDTPGHEAFTALRARGANVTDIVVLVVGADDGVMPQTAEAISHAHAAEVPIIVAINKMDLEAADPYNVRAQLTEHGVVVEELGGEVLNAEVSALNGTGVDHLLDLIELTAEVEELKANPEAPASGTVIESQLDKGRGPVGTVVIQRGTLGVGDAMLAGAVSGRVRAMFDENGKQVKKAGPSTPVLVMGWSEVPSAGDFFEVVADERTARSLASDRLTIMRADQLIVPTAQERLAQLLEQLRSAEKAELNLIIKADAHGSLEAIRDAVEKMQREDAEVMTIHAAVGGINENDVVLAETSEAVIVGFNVRPDAPARRASDQRGVEIRTYRIIYELLEDVQQILVGRLAPEEVELLLGAAEVRATFRAPRFGTVAGCYVTEGEMVRNARIRLVRDGVVAFDGNISSLRRFKDDVQRVASGFECGIGLAGFKDIKEGDILESYEVREVART